MLKHRELFTLAAVLLLASAAFAQRPFILQPNYFAGFSSPVAVTHAGDGTRRLFVVEQGGKIRVAQPGSTTFTDYLTVTVSTGGERGLLGLAFHPQFELNRRFFIYYTRTGDGAIEISEYEQSASNPNIANPTRVRVIITIPHPGASNHNGGTVAFGPDGFLYAGTGDGGGGNDPNNNAQNINSLLGKMIRLDINTPPTQTPAYNIPADNPYVGVAGADEIYAIGLRNPYRFSFDRGGTNQLWVADVGQGSREEVSIVTRGGNFGWRVYEGNNCTNLDPTRCAGGTNPITHNPPVFDYGRVRDPSDTANRCSITGGYVYRGTQNALPQGSYIYGDYCTGEIMLWNGSTQTILRDTGNFSLVGFGEDEDGEIYIARLNGTIEKIAGERTNADFNGDGGTDFSLYRPNDGNWYTFSPVTGLIRYFSWGVSIDKPVADDYDADGVTDVAVFRPENGVWYYVRSSNNTFGIFSWGAGDDIPAPGDFDGDAKADLTVYRPNNGYWYTIRSSDGQFSFTSFGGADDVPVNGDYDGDGKDDIAVYRVTDSSWYYVNSSDGQVRGDFLGLPGDKPTPGDFDGDGKLDLAVFRASNATFYIRYSSNFQIVERAWGVATDLPAIGDYDRDNRDDIAVYRPSNGSWYIIRSSDNTFFGGVWGASDDTSIPGLDRP